MIVLFIVYAKDKGGACYDSQHKIPDERGNIGKIREDNGDTTGSPPFAKRRRVFGLAKGSEQPDAPLPGHLYFLSLTATYLIVERLSSPEWSSR